VTAGGRRPSPRKLDTPHPESGNRRFTPPKCARPPYMTRHHAAAGTRPHRATTRNARLHAATLAISTALAQDGQAKQSRRSKAKILLRRRSITSRRSITRAAPCLYRTGQHQAFQQTTSSSPSALPCPRMLGEPKRARKSTGDNLASGSVEAQCDPPALNPQFQ
jgi:hypothetical protein